MVKKETLQKIIKQHTTNLNQIKERIEFLEQQQAELETELEILEKQQRAIEEVVDRLEEKVFEL